MKKILLCVSAAVLILTACEKDEDEEPANVTPTVANVSGSYKIVAMTAAGQNVFDNGNAAMNWMDPCQRDDVYALLSYSAPNTSGTYTVTDAGTVCSPTTTDSGTWSLTNSTTINIDGIDATITSFNGQKLVTTENFQGVSVVTTYQKQ